MTKIVITELDAGQRFDKFLLRFMNASTKSFVYKLLRTNKIKLNGKKATGNKILSVGDMVVLFLPEKVIEENQKSRQILAGFNDLDVLYEDANVLIVDKKAGTLVHADKKNVDNTLVDRAAAYLAKKGELSNFLPTAVHRLDRNTSGIVAMAKNLPAAQFLSQVFKERTVEKVYFAVVNGEISEKFEISGQLVKDEKKNIVSFSEEGKDSLTEIVPVAHNGEFSLVKAYLRTGRTHQIRAHLSSMGNPVVGDKKYGDKTTFLPKNRIYLHAFSLLIKEETGFLSYLANKNFVCPLPSDIINFLKKKDLDYEEQNYQCFTKFCET